MAVNSAFGTISILATDTATTTKVVSGLAFPPKVVFFFGSGHASGSDGIESGDYKAGFGFAHSPTERRAVGGWSDHGVATTSSRGAYSETACFIQSGTGAIDGALDIQSMDESGFTAVIDDQFAADVRVHWLAIGGADLLDAIVGSFQTPTGAGTQDITDVGFAPDFVFFAKAGRSTNPPPDSVQDCGWGFGAWTRSGGVQWTCAVTSNHAVVLGTTQTMRYFRGGECISGFNAASTAIEARAEATAALSNGFRLNWLEVGGTGTWNFYLAIRGGGYQTGTSTIGAGVSSHGVYGLNFQPTSLLVFTTNQPENVADTPGDHNVLSIGAAANVSQRGAVLMRDTDAQATATECLRAIEYDAVSAMESAGAIVGIMDLREFHPTGFVLEMDDLYPSDVAIGWVAIGPPEVVAQPHEGTKPWSSVWRARRI